MFINLAQAAEGIVGCSGGDCGTCSLLETISNIYNFLLGTGFAVAVLVLVLAGSEYVLSGGNTRLFNKAKKFARAGVFGFIFLLIGWLIVHLVVSITGFKDSYLWWNFECVDDISLRSTDYLPKNSFGDRVNFKDIESFLKSKELSGKIEGNLDFETILKQLYGLEEGQSLKFLAPQSLGTGVDSEKALAEFLTVKKENGEVDLENIGDYLNTLAGNASLLTKSQESNLTEENLSLLEKYFGQQTSKQSLVGVDEKVIDGGNIGQSEALYSTLTQVLKSINNEGNLASNADLFDKSPAELLALAMEYSKQNNGQGQEDRLIATLLAETIKMAGVLGVEKTKIENEDDGFLDNFNYNSNENTNSNNNHNDNENSLESEAEENCVASGGSWLTESGLGEKINRCGGQSVNENINADLSKGYCRCPEDKCFDKEGICIKEGVDSDEDGIPNEEDRCPKTPPAEKTAINKNRGANYGCSCFDLGSRKKQCPQSSCEGDFMLFYPIDNQICKNGEFQPYSCGVIRREENEQCRQENPANQNRNDNSSGGSSGNGAGKGPDKITDDFSKNKDDKSLPPGSGSSGHNTERGDGSPEAIKKALRRIEEKDPLRYEMIMRFTKKIERTSFPGGLCYGCGYFQVNASLPIGVLDQVIMHEATHSAHHCVDGNWGSISKTERIAVANECGSMCREENPDMREFPKQKEGVTYKGKEVRGYAARYQTKATPQGNLGTNAFRSNIAYAFSYGDRTEGPYKYGDCESKIVIGMKENEEDVIKRAVTSQRNCFSRPTSDLPKVSACENAKDEIIIR